MEELKDFATDATAFVRAVVIDALARSGDFRLAEFFGRIAGARKKSQAPLLWKLAFPQAASRLAAVLPTFAGLLDRVPLPWPSRLALR